VSAEHLVLLPTGVGEARRVPTGPISSYFPAARWLPDGRHFLVVGAEKGQRSRVYLQAIDGGDPRPVSREGEYGRLVVLPDGKRFITRGLDRRLAVFAIDGDADPRRLEGTEGGDLPIVVSPDGAWLFVQGPAHMPGEVARVALGDGRREAVSTLQPPDPAGAIQILRIVMAPDGRSYAYTFVRALSSLYVVDGLR
jgi:hypothetical protein